MKVSLNWLKQYVDITLPAAEIADKLTMAGNEVKGIQEIGGRWQGIVIGQITAVNPHPDADRLTMVTVDLGDRQETVVCGAPNVRPGAKVAFAPVGSELIDPGSGEMVRLKSAKIRGVVSNGMACSEKELGISDDHQGILILAEEAPVGGALADYLGDVIFNMDITPNRPDCLSMVGIAREIAALTGQDIHLPEANYIDDGSPIDQQVAVEITAPDLCPRYCASLITGVKIAESPQWMQERLISYGMRPINNIVDITNFVMLEYGQPLHAFDYQKIRGHKIIVRRARDGEAIISLDGTERVLTDDMLVIADEEHSVAVAGVMGGANSEVSQQTTAILLESASFRPSSIHYTGRTLGMPSEACMRFERGISPEITMPALKRATQLIVDLGGGTVARGVIDVYPGKAEPQPIRLSTDDVKRVLGVEFSVEQIISALTAMGFDCRWAEPDSAVRVTVPEWRSDINLVVDLIEEIARVIGYDSVPLTMLSQPIPEQDPDHVIQLKREIINHLTGYGFQEIISYSLTSWEALQLLPNTAETRPLRLVNPMTTEQEYLRPNLRVSLLGALSVNRSQIESGIRLYELGKVYLPRSGDLPDEREVLCGLLGGPGIERSWHGDGESPDFYEAKGIVEGLLGQLGVTACYQKLSDDDFHQNQQAAIVVDGVSIGIVGQLHPRVLEGLGIAEPVYLFEIDLQSLLPFTSGYRVFQPVPRFPAIIRDMALVLADGIAYQEVLDIIQEFPLVVRVILFDVYSGGPVPQGKKSLAYRIIYQSSTDTLTDAEVNEVQQQILGRLSDDLGASLRA